MKIKVTSVYVDDQSKALRFYTEVLGFAKKTDFSQGPYRWLTVASPEEPDGTELQLALNNNPAGQSVPAGDVSTGPAGGDVLHRRRQGRLRADQGPRRRVHDAAHRRDRLDHCDAERHLRQPHSAHPAGTLFTLRRKKWAIASSTHRVRPAGRRYARTERSGRSFSSENCATRRKKSGRRLPTPRICASGRPSTPMRAWVWLETR